jgi:hypothetical protein
MASLCNKNIIISICLIAYLLVGCEEKLIPEKDMVPIFVEVFITDAVVSTAHFSQEFTRRDSIDYYKPIYSKFGYTEAQFTKTVQFYLSKPDALDKILDKVVNELAKLEIINQQKYSLPERQVAKDVRLSKNLWKGRRNWTLPINGTQEMIEFEVPFEGPGIYSATADVKVLPKDESINPEMTIWFNVKDEYSETIAIGQKSTQYNKDGETQTITLAAMYKDTTALHFAGRFMNHQPKSGTWEKHSQVSNITILYSPFENFKNHNKNLFLKDTLAFSYNDSIYKGFNP